MSGDRLAPWRKTGRKADGRHFEGLEEGCLFEFAAYDNRHQQQGRGLGCIGGRAIETHIDGGQVYTGQVLALEDGYYEYWFDETFGKIEELPQVIFHFCDVPENCCQSPTAYRDAIHVDVFRLLMAKQAERLHWLSDGCRERVRKHPAVVSGLAAAEGGFLPLEVLASLLSLRRKMCRWAFLVLKAWPGRSGLELLQPRRQALRPSPALNQSMRRRGPGRKIGPSMEIMNIEKVIIRSNQRRRRRRSARRQEVAVVRARRVAKTCVEPWRSVSRQNLACLPSTLPSKTRRRRRMAARRNQRREILQAVDDHPQPAPVVASFFIQPPSHKAWNASAGCTRRSQDVWHR